MRPARTLAAAAAATGIALGAGAQVASAETPPNTPPTPAPLTFVPPRVDSIGVYIGPVIIGGRLMSPGISITMPPVTVPWPPPSQA